MSNPTNTDPQPSGGCLAPFLMFVGVIGIALGGALFLYARSLEVPMPLLLMPLSPAGIGAAFFFRGLSMSMSSRSD